MEKWVEVFAKWIIKYRWWIIVIALGLVSTFTYGIQNLKLSYDSRVFFSKKNPQLKALEAFEKIFNKNDNVLIVIAPKDREIFTKKTLSAIEELTEKCWKIPYSSRVDSITNFQHISSSKDEVVVTDLVKNAISFSQKEIEEKKALALSEPEIMNKLISPSAHVSSININIIKPDEALSTSKEIDSYVRNLLKDFRNKYPGLDVYLSGTVVLNSGFGKAAEDDMASLIPLMYIVLILFIGITLRWITGVFIVLVILVFSMLSGMGISGWIGLSINSISANAPTIILTLAVADCMHLLETILYLIRQGKTKKDAIIESLRTNFVPLFLTSATTATGLLTMNFSDAPPFHDFGNITALGVMSAFIYTIFFLPALLMVLPIKVKKISKQKPVLGDLLTGFVTKYQRPIMYCICFLVVVCIIGISKIEIRDNFNKYFGENYDFRRAYDFIEKNLTGFDVIEYSLSSGKENGIYNPEYLSKVEEFANWYKAQDNVVHVSAITDSIKRINKAMHGDNQDFYRIPDQRKLSAQYFLVYEMSLPFGLDLTDRISVDKSSSRLTVNIKKADSKTLINMDKKAHEWLMHNAPKEMVSYGTGIHVIFSHLLMRNIKRMLNGSYLAIFIISGLLIVAIRSLKFGLLSLIPNLLPAFVAFGLWGMIIGQMGLAVSIIVVLTLGIVVDDSIYFLVKYRYARKKLEKIPVEAIRYSFDTVGAALLKTSIILFAGFSVLVFSNFKMNSDMGLMTVITIMIALAMDFFLLPILVMKIDEKTYETNIVKDYFKKINFARKYN